MLYFNSDYLEGAHPAVLQRLLDTNLEQTVGYGQDAYCAQAKDKIRDRLPLPQRSGGIPGGRHPDQRHRHPQSPAAPIRACLAADTGHIALHEAGAIEATAVTRC